MKKFRSILAAAAVIALSACSSGSAVSYNAGTYTGTAEGHNGDVTVEVEVSDSAIVKVTVTEHGETDGICDGALEQIPGMIVKANSADVDTVSGCTDTSEAIINAVKNALAEAKG